MTWMRGLRKACVVCDINMKGGGKDVTGKVMVRATYCTQNRRSESNVEEEPDYGREYQYSEPD